MTIFKQYAKKHLFNTYINSIVLMQQFYIYIYIYVFEKINLLNTLTLYV